MMSEQLFIHCKSELLKLGINSFDKYYYDKFLRLTNGNIGSIMALLEIAKKANSEHLFDQFLKCLSFKGIGNERLHILFKNVCNEDTDKLYYIISLIFQDKIDNLTLNYILVDIPETLKYRTIIIADIFKSYTENKES